MVHEGPKYYMKKERSAAVGLEEIVFHQRAHVEKLYNYNFVSGEVKATMIAMFSRIS